MEKRKFRTITVLADIVILTLSFLAVAGTKPTGLKSYVPSHISFFAGLAVMWIIVSLINGKMNRGKIINFSTLFTRVLSSNFIAISITALVMYLFREYFYSRTIVFGTAILATILELLAGSVFIAYKKALVQDYEEYEKYKTYKKNFKTQKSTPHQTTNTSSKNSKTSRYPQEKQQAPHVLMQQLNSWMKSEYPI